MIGENGWPETPEWVCEPHECPCFDRADHHQSPPPLPPNIIPGDN
jgi:hypothetical protein